MTKLNKAVITKDEIKAFISELIYAYMQDKVVTRKELSKILNVSLKTLDTYIKKGMPWFGKNTRKMFNIVDCRKWIDANK